MVDVLHSVLVVCTRTEEVAQDVVNVRLGTVGTSIEIVTSGTIQVVHGLGGDIGTIIGQHFGRRFTISGGISGVTVV